jgi:hypothetical protein
LAFGLLYAVGIASSLGCGEKPAAPPAIDQNLQQSIKLSLIRAGAKVTADEPHDLCASLRNTHIRVRDAGGIVQGVRRSRQDLQDFGRINEAVAREFLDEGEVPAFQQWLREAIVPAGPGAARAEYGSYQLSVSRSPLRVVFAPRSTAVD